MNCLPEKYNKKWLFIGGVTAIICLVLAIIARGIVVLNGGDIGVGLIFMVFIVLGVNLLLALVGFLGAKIFYGVVEPAVLAFGFMSMLIASVDQAGWEILSGVLVFILLLGCAIVLGVILNLVLYIKKVKTLGQLTKILCRVYIGLLAVLMLITPSQLDFETSDYHTKDMVPLEGTLESVIYTRRTAEYENVIEVLEDTLIYTTTEFDPVTGDVIDSKTENRSLNGDELYNLETFILEETELIYESEDVSTTKSILDAEYAVIQMNFIYDTFDVGGYYPYDNESFSLVSDYIKEMIRNWQNE